jgi:hypothetical protein
MLCDAGRLGIISPALLYRFFRGQRQALEIFQRTLKSIQV